MSLVETAKRYSLTVEQLDAAAQALTKAVGTYIEGTATGRGRRTESGFAFAVRESVGRQRVSKELFALVVNRAIQLELLERRTNPSSGRVFLAPRDELKGVAAPELVTVSTVEDVVQVRAATASDAPRAGAVPPKGPPPDGYRCSHCNYQAQLCVHCGEPPYDDELYVDSKGRWRCSSCNDLAFMESWGGVTRWMRPYAPAGEE